jgi:hypothetical protein
MLMLFRVHRYILLSRYNPRTSIRVHGDDGALRVPLGGRVKTHLSLETGLELPGPLNRGYAR